MQSVITNLRAVGIGVGLVVLVGSGGRSAGHEHVTSTLSLLESLHLDRSDLITLVDARGLDASTLEEFEPLSDEEIEGQVTAFKSLSQAGRPSKGPKVVVYNPDKQST